MSNDNKWIHDYYDELSKQIKDIEEVETIADRLAMEDVENLDMEG